MRKAVKGRISTVMSGLLSTRTEQCGDGKKRTRNLLSTRSRSDPAACEISQFQYPLIIANISDRFRWVFCQLDRLRRCFSPSIRRILNELPATLDETYERTLQEIPKIKRSMRIDCFNASLQPFVLSMLRSSQSYLRSKLIKPQCLISWKAGGLKIRKKLFFLHVPP